MVAVLIVVTVALLVVAGLIALRLAMRSPKGYRGPDLEPYELAQLAAGRFRVLNTVLASLAAEGRVRIPSTGHLTLTGTTSAGPVRPLEAEVLSLLEGRPTACRSGRSRRRWSGGRRHRADRSAGEAGAARRRRLRAGRPHPRGAGRGGPLPPAPPRGQIAAAPSPGPRRPGRSGRLRRRPVRPGPGGGPRTGRGALHERRVAAVRPGQGGQALRSVRARHGRLR
ncbi:TIGR04222 domain-containing membrane protein [Streptosporangium lutulentum]